LRSRVAQRQHDGVNSRPETLCGNHTEIAGFFLDEIDDFSSYRSQGRARTGNGVAEQFLEIVAVELPRGEGVSLRAWVPTSEPFKEVLGLVGPGAHQSGRHVEQVMGAQGAVGDASSEPLSPLENEDAQ
jgi:hypothetical protein